MNNDNHKDNKDVFNSLAKKISLDTQPEQESQEITQLKNTVRCYQEMVKNIFGL